MAQCGGACANTPAPCLGHSLPWTGSSFSLWSNCEVTSDVISGKAETLILVGGLLGVPRTEVQMRRVPFSDPYPRKHYKIKGIRSLKYFSELEPCYPADFMDGKLMRDGCHDPDNVLWHQRTDGTAYVETEAPPGSHTDQSHRANAPLPSIKTLCNKKTKTRSELPRVLQHIPGRNFLGATKRVSFRVSVSSVPERDICHLSRRRLRERAN